jgi:hypothetical protein
MNELKFRIKISNGGRQKGRRFLKIDNVPTGAPGALEQLKPIKKEDIDETDKGHN